jgi:hypothetical protein
MQSDRIDFSSLDPTRNGPRWEASVRSVSARALAGHRSPVLWQVTAWARPALAMAVLAALVCWLPAFARTATGEASTASVDGARALSEWATSRPSTSSNEVLSSLGVSQ